MKINIKYWILSVLIILLLAKSGMAADEYSAEMISTGPEGQAKGMIYFSKDKLRMDMAGSISISRMDKKIVWIVMADEKMYIEQTFDPKKMAAITEKIVGESERTLLGKEMVDGIKTEKYKVVREWMGKKDVLIQWLDPVTKIAVKTEAEDGSWKFEMKNIKLGPVDQSLFEVPAGYEKLEMPSFGNMPEESPKE